MPNVRYVVSTAVAERRRASTRLLAQLRMALLPLLAILLTGIAPKAQAQAVSGALTLSQQISAFAGNGSTSPVATPTAVSDSGVGVVPQAVAVDSAGNVYIADSNINAVEMITPGGNISVIAGTGSTQPSGTAIAATSASLNLPAYKTSLTLDAAGNLYVADYISATNITVIDEITAPASGNAQIVALFGNGGSSTPYTTPIPLSRVSLQNSHITGMVFDSTGNLYLADNNNDGVMLVTGLGGSNAKISVIAGFNCGQQGASPTPQPANNPCVYPYGIATDSAGNLYVSDQYNNNNQGTVDLITGASGANPQITAIAGYNCSRGPYTYPEQANQACISPYGIAADAKGNLYIDDQNSNGYVDVITGASGGNAQITAVAGYHSTGNPPTTTPEPAEDAYFFIPVGIAVDSAGNVYVADDRTDLLELLTPSFTNVLPSTSVGSVSTSQNVQLALTASSAISSITVPKAQNGAQEFTINAAGITGCVMDGSTINSTGTICTIPVTFNPQYPGVRTGALTVNNGSTVVGTLGLNGVGNGPLGVFQPGTQSTVATTGLTAPNGIAVDEAGDLFVADYGNSRVVEIAAGGTQSVVPFTGLSGPVSVAVDAAGNLYVSDPSNKSVTRLTPGGMQVSASEPAIDIAADASGNVFGFAPFIGGRWIVLEDSNGSLHGVIFSSLGKPNGIAVDAADDVYITDCNNDDVVELTPAGAQTTVPTTGLSCPAGIAVDAGGDLYIADSGNSRVVEVTPSGVQITLAIAGLGTPAGVAIDGAGNLYVVDNKNNDVVKLNPSATAALSFAADGTGDASAQQTVTLANIGNQPLNITALNTTTTGQTTSSFTLNGAATTCTSSTSLTAGVTCGLGVEFDPLVAGSLAGTVNITDNSLNIAANVQTISLNGTGTGYAATLTVTPSATTAAYGTSITVTATVTGSNGTPSGSITYTLDGTLMPAVTLNASGVATFALPSELAAGTHSVTVNYGGDANYIDATTAQSVNFTVTGGPASGGPTPSVTLSSKLTSLNVPQGATITDDVTITSVNGYTGTITLSCPTLPANASCVMLPSATVNIAANSTVTVTLDISTQNSTAAAVRPYAPLETQSNPMPMLAGAFWLPGLLAAGAGLRKRRDSGVTSHARHMLVLLVLLAGVGLMTACGGSATPATTTQTGAGPMTAKGTYTVPVQVAGSNGLATQTLNLTLTVQ